MPCKTTPKPSQAKTSQAKAKLSYRVWFAFSRCILSLCARSDHTTLHYTALRRRDKRVNPAYPPFDGAQTKIGKPPSSPSLHLSFSTAKRRQARGPKKSYRLVQIERQKLCAREFLTPFFRVRPRNFAHIFWTSLSKTRRGGFFNFLSRWPVIRGPGWST